MYFEVKRRMIMTNYYILVTANGKRIPVKTKITIKSLVIANCFSDEIIKSFYAVDFIRYLMMEN